MFSIGFHKLTRSIMATE